MSNSQPAQSVKYRVLLIEDDRAIAQAYAFKLQLDGYEVVIKEDGLDAVHYIKELPQIDLVLLDLRIPKIPGETVLEKLRAIDKYAETPVIVLTNLGREEAPKTIWHHGISRYVVKVTKTPKELMHIIEDVMQNKEIN